MGSFIAAGGRKSEFGGYYIHLEPGTSFVGGGVWCPEADVLRAIRQDRITSYNVCYTKLLRIGNAISLTPRLVAVKIE